ncbi:protein RRNAD1-like [Thrips palmi]|uniref:Protein RRNAD1-like n=1 Tax=Thrips palmi TaxID=161013 RepID=A0A6P8YVY6_THRPL|nr:protein RRNAD1-like [Thrips palmi]
MSTEHLADLDDMRNLSREETSALKCLKLIQHYKWLLDAFVLDFFTENHWGLLPLSWRETLHDTSLEELGSWISMTESKCERVWPLSLLSLRASVKALSIPRSQLDLSDPSNINSGGVTSLKKTLRAGMETECLRHENLRQLFVRHVKPKKQHETVVMAKLCAKAALDSNVTCVVDVGGGKGHLTRLLSYGYGLDVCCVEAQSDLISSAREIDKKIEYTASKYLGKSYVDTLPCPEYIDITVGRSDEALHQFRELVFNKLNKNSDETVSFGIVGLHPCGDLAATLLHLFLNLNEAKFICIASCCYMKLSCNPCDELRSYPLSNFFLALPEELTNLSYEALELSCHALEAYCQRLEKQQYEVLKIHCYRAVLEKLITKYNPEMKRIGLRSVKHFDEMDFSTYATRALNRIDVIIPPTEMTSPDTVQKLERWKDVVVLYTLRLLLAPLVETAVIWDRLLFIQESGVSGLVIPGFDPVLSPRNLILKGLKPK